ncbi:MAG: hypothetical protein U0V87_01160 [Acidobacteriota bacterium]
MTGASGFLGRTLCTRQRSIGADVHGTSRAAHTSTVVRSRSGEAARPRSARSSSC